jgi:hypothetical protein
VQSGCGKRLRTTSGKRYQVEEGRVCEGCYKKNNKKEQLQEQEQQQPPAPATPLREKRQPRVPPPPLLSPEQRRQLSSIKEPTNFCQQGRSLSAPERATIVLQVGALQQLAETPACARVLSYDRVVKTVAAGVGSSPATVRSIVKRFHSEGDIKPEAKKPKIDRDNPLHPMCGEGGPSMEARSVIHTVIEQSAAQNTYASSTTMRADVAAATGEKAVSKTTMLRWLKGMKFEHGEKKLSGLQVSYAHARVRRYLLKYSELLKREEAGEIVIVYTDESYIHANYSKRFSWFHRDNDVVPNRVRGDSSGKRLIIIDAMTKDGMLRVEGADPSDDLSEECESASIVTSRLSIKGPELADYHETMNNETFRMYLQNRLIPAFKAKYPDKKMVLILDNAKYHHARGPDWVNANKMTKPMLGTFLRQAKVPQIILPGGRVIKKDKYTADVKAGGPTVEMLKDVVRDYIRSHPNINTTLVQQEMSQHGYELLYTPPYESWIQPIELVWGRVKHRVATQSRLGRKWQETQEQTKVALRNISGETCAKLIKHTHRLMDEWLKTPHAGSLRKHKSLQALGALSRTQRELCSDLNMEDELEVGDAEEE